jgi:hypothetical protein
MKTLIFLYSINLCFSHYFYEDLFDSSGFKTDHITILNGSEVTYSTIYNEDFQKNMIEKCVKGVIIKFY